MLTRLGNNGIITERLNGQPTVRVISYWCRDQDRPWNILCAKEKEEKKKGNCKGWKWFQNLEEEEKIKDMNGEGRRMNQRTDRQKNTQEIST